MKAMILAAGYGTRLGIMSNQKPKPMLPVFNIPLITYAVELLKSAGIVEIGVNLHHRGNILKEYLKDGKDFGVDIFWSYEDGQILGTGGGVKKISDFFGNERCIVLNGKIVTDLDLKSALKFHEQNNALGTMVLKPDENASKWGSIGVDAKGKLISMLGKDIDKKGVPSAPNMFTGIQILEPDFIKKLPDGPSCIVRQGWIPFFHEKKPLFGYVMPPENYWWEHSTPERYLRGNMNFFKYKLFDTLPINFSDYGVNPDKSFLCGHNLQTDGKFKIGNNVIIGNNVKLKGTLNLSDCVIWDNTEVTKNLSHAIATPEGIVQTDPASAGAFTGPVLKV